MSLIWTAEFFMTISTGNKQRSREKKINLADREPNSSRLSPKESRIRFIRDIRRLWSALLRLMIWVITSYFRKEVLTEISQTISH